MKKHKKYEAGFLLLISGIFLMSTNLFAQNRPDHRPPALPDSTRIVEMIDKLGESLVLTGEQKEKIAELHFAHFAEVKELMEKTKSNRENHRREMDAIREQFEDEVKALLSDKQQAEFEKFMKNRDPRPIQPRRRQ